MSSRFAHGLALAGALLLAACGNGVDYEKIDGPAAPALWEITGNDGERGWVFGTAHSLPEGLDWQTPILRRAVSSSDRLVLEIADPGDTRSIANVFSDLGASPGQPPLSARLPAAMRPALADLLARARASDDRFVAIETWAAALILARAARGPREGESVDVALLALARGRPVTELEGVRAQLAIFDSLPEQDQRDLLAAVVRDAPMADAQSERLARLWRRGRTTDLARETRRGMLLDLELREALLLARNRRWSDKVEAMLNQGQHPFVAVGAGHVVGAEGLPELLRQRGWRVRRIQ